MSARRPRHVSAAQNMGVEMVDRLAGVGASIYDHPISPIQTLLPSDVSGQSENLAQGRWIARMGERNDMLPWDDQNVDGRLGVQVAKGYRRFALRHQSRRDLAADDLAENTGRGIIRHENHQSE